MIKGVFFTILLLIVGDTFAKEYSTYWLCADHHLEPLKSQGDFKGKPLNLFINFNNLQDGSLHYSRVNDSKVTIPLAMEQGNYLLLGGKGDWEMNCVGQIVKEADNEPKVIFDVSRNAFGCPLVPQGCEANTLALLSR